MIDKPKTTFGPVTNGIGAYWLPSGTRRHRVVYTQGGKVRSKGGFTTKTAAIHWQAHNTTAIDNNTYLDRTKQKALFGPYATQWLEDAAEGVGREKPLRPKTVQLYDSLLRNHILPAFETMRFRDIDRQEVKGWLAILTKQDAPGPSTIAKAYRLLRQILQEAVEDGYLTTNPANIKGAGSEPKPDESKYEDLTPNVVRRLANHMQDEVWWDERNGRKVRRHRSHAKYKPLILLAGLDGLRWGEAIALERRHINPTTGTVRIRQQVIELKGQPPTLVHYTKTDAGSRTVHLTGETLRAVRHHLDTHTELESTARLFPSRERSGKTAYLRESNFRRDVWRPAVHTLWPDADDSELANLVFHDLRHAAGMLAASTGAPLKDLMRHLGHKSEKAALRYQHATEDSQRALVDRIDAALSLTPAETERTGTDNVVPINGR